MIQQAAVPDRRGAEPLPIGAATVRAVWLADLHPDRVQSGSVARFVFVPGSATDQVDGCVLVEAAGPPGVLRTVQVARGERDEGLDVAQNVVEGVLTVIRHPARGEFPAVVVSGAVFAGVTALLGRE